MPDGGEVWRALPEPHSYFGRLDVGYTGPSGPGSIVMLGPAPDYDGAAAARRRRPGNSRRRAHGGGVHGDERSCCPIRRCECAAPLPRSISCGSYLAGWRNLGEQAVRIGVARVQEIAVRARIEVTGGIDVEQLLAGIFADLDQMLSPRVRFESLSSRRRTQPDSDGIYDGPLLRNGFLATDVAADAHPAVLFLSDVLRLIMRRRSATRSDVVTQENPVGRDIVAVTDLTLTNFINNRPITSDAEDCLHLVEIERYRPRLSVAKSRIVAVRNDSEVSYDLDRVERLFDRLARAGGGGIADGGHVAGVAGAARRSAAGRGVHAAAGGSAGHLRRRSLRVAGQRRAHTPRGRQATARVSAPVRAVAGGRHGAARQRQPVFLRRCRREHDLLHQAAVRPAGRAERS